MGIINDIPQDPGHLVITSDFSEDNEYLGTIED
jgi:hypothetical protein